MKRLVLLEASLETVPEEIAYHADVIRAARLRKKRAEEMLLEDYLHFRAIRKLSMAEKRGRPDIVHRCLLLALDSGVFEEIYVHTVAGRIIRVSGETRLPRTYERFRGLMEKLFREERIEANGRVLLEIVDARLEEVAGEKAVLLRESGARLRRKERCEIIRSADSICLGAFPHGDYEEETLRALKRAREISLGEESYSSLYALCRVLCCFDS